MCSSADSGITNACRRVQTCVTGHGGCDTCAVGMSEYNQIDHIDDNLALDNWCAGKIGVKDTFSHQYFDYY